jgi:serine/threonine protein kinase
MNYLHQNNIFLYELKASNVILLDDDNIVIRNFGFGEFLTQRSKKIKSSAAPWASPEILRGENYQKVSDIYSFGILMWELSARSKVYQELTKSKEIKNYVLNYGRPNLQLIESDTPEWYIGLMKDCWSNKKEDRPAPFKIMDILKNELSKFGE